MVDIFRGDDTDSFDQVWGIINAEFPEEWVITGAEFKVGNLPTLWFDNPEFPLEVNLPSSQTALLKDVNTCYLSLYDDQGRKQTCEGSYTFKTRKRAV